MLFAQDETDLPDDDDNGDTEYFRHVLRKLVDIGMTVAAAIEYTATAQASAAVTGETDSRDAAPLLAVATAYDRVSRAVRRTVALAQRLDTPLPRKARATARRRIIREVEDAIDHAASDPAETVALATELSERLDDPNLDEDIATRPIPEIIADICRDLGLTLPGPTPRTAAPGKRRTPGDVQALHQRAAQPRQHPAPTALAIEAADHLFRNAPS